MSVPLAVPLSALHAQKNFVQQPIGRETNFYKHFTE